MLPRKGLEMRADVLDHFGGVVGIYLFEKLFDRVPHLRV